MVRKLSELHFAAQHSCYFSEHLPRGSVYYANAFHSGKLSAIRLIRKYISSSHVYLALINL